MTATVAIAAARPTPTRRPLPELVAHVVALALRAAGARLAGVVVRLRRAGPRDPKDAPPRRIPTTRPIPPSPGTRRPALPPTPWSSRASWSRWTRTKRSTRATCSTRTMRRCSTAPPRREARCAATSRRRGRRPAGGGPARARSPRRVLVRIHRVPEAVRGVRDPGAVTRMNALGTRGRLVEHGEDERRDVGLDLGEPRLAVVAHERGTGLLRAAQEIGAGGAELTARAHALGAWYFSETCLLVGAAPELPPTNATPYHDAPSPAATH